MKEIPKTYNFKEIEKEIYPFWLKVGFFNPDKLPKRFKKSYCIVLPPPNVTGELHMGHALNATIQDILIRWKRLQGFKTLWVPGIDHAGIATQNVVEKQLKKEGISRLDLGRERFLKRVWEWVEKYGGIILEQFKKLGCSLDWSRKAFTLDKKYCKAINQAFAHYYKKGWIYKGQRPINWCPRCQTSLSDLEVEHKESKGNLWYIRYPLKEGKGQGAKGKRGYIVVATTRPETMLGDAAVAVNPSDKRYKNLVGKKVLLPLVKRTIPIVADGLVDPKFGTGAVKVTPAHDFLDYKIYQKHKLEFIPVIDENRKISQNAPLPYQGLDIKEARKKIIEDLKKEGLLEKVEKHTISLPQCYRCKTIIEIIPSEQWFLKMEKLAQLSKKVVRGGKIKFQPKNFEKGYFAWLDNIQDWCISRQIWWGHPLPIWRCQKKTKNYFLSLETPKRCLVCGKCKPKQIDDVLDTWFSSALWPFAVLGWPQKTKDLKTFYPTDVLVTGRDIINLWVARMIFSGLEFMKKIPFRRVFIHPTILTKEGKRMSKSLGTGIDPLELVKKYGVDATRFGLAWQLTGIQDLRFGEEHIVMGKKFCNKIWNASRFLMLSLSGSKNILLPSKLKTLKEAKHLGVADKKILNALEKTIKSVNKNLENFRFGKATQALYHFFWHQFCDFYIEKAKEKLAKGSLSQKSQTKKVLLFVLLASLKLLHPFMPYITEKIYQMLPLKNKEKSITIESWPQ